MKPKAGETVRVHYTGTLADGSQFDTSEGRDPIAFTLGEGTVIPGFESAVSELEVGDSSTVTIPAEEAYGERNENAVQEVPLEAFGDSGAPQPGWVVQLENPDGQQINAMVREVRDDIVVLDFNHPLAGQDLTFDLKLVEIVGQ